MNTTTTDFLKQLFLKIGLPKHYHKKTNKCITACNQLTFKGFSFLQLDVQIVMAWIETTVCLEGKYIIYTKICKLASPSPHLSQRSHTDSHQPCGELQVGGHVLEQVGGLLFLEDPPYGFPSVWQRGRTDPSHNLCVQNSEQGATLITITHVDAYEHLRAECVWTVCTDTVITWKLTDLVFNCSKQTH